MDRLEDCESPALSLFLFSRCISIAPQCSFLFALLINTVAVSYHYGPAIIAPRNVRAMDKGT
jgi:hypothetical protein